MIDSHIDGLKAFLGRYTDFIEQRKLNKDPAGNEFQLIKQQAIEDRQQIQANEGAKEVNKQKNRYKDILPYDYSRVVLPKEDSIEGSDYINANFIKDGSGNTSYIAAQAPMPSTVDDFWRMIWTYDVKLVIMACKEVELGKPRCQRYWPDEGQECWFKDIKVTLFMPPNVGFQEEKIESVNIHSPPISLIISDNGSRDFTKTLTLRDLKLLRNGKEKYVTQMHYTDWPDHGAPETTEPIIQLIKLARKKHPDDNPPIVVHCSAGCGRTGAIIAIDYARKLLHLKKASDIDVLSIVMDLRRQRPSMVQAKEQLEFLYDVIRDMVSTELSKYTVPDDVENSNYVNIGFLHTDTFGSKQSLINKSPSLHKKQIKQDSPFLRSKSLHNTESPTINSDKENAGPQEDSFQQRNIKNRDILFEQIKRQHNAGQNKDRKLQHGQSNEPKQQIKLYQVKPQDVNNIYPTKDLSSETKLLKTTAVIPPNTLLSTAALKMKEAEKNGNICQMLESLDSKNDFGIVKSSKHVSEKSEKASSYGQPQKFNVPPSKVNLDSNSNNGNIVTSRDYAQLSNRSIPIQLQAGLINPYSIVKIGNNKVAQSDSISSSSQKLSVEATPPLPERTPESFIIVAPENEKSNAHVRQNSFREKTKLSADVSTHDPYILPQDLLEPDYSTLTECNFKNASNAESSASASCPPASKWFSAISKMKNYTKKSGKPADATFLSFDNYGFNSLGFPNRLNIKPKGQSYKPSHWT